jgi:hypothetical protein
LTSGSKSVDASFARRKGGLGDAELRAIMAANASEGSDAVDEEDDKEDEFEEEEEFEHDMTWELKL